MVGKAFRVHLTQVKGIKQLKHSYRLHGLEWCSVNVDSTVQGFGDGLKRLGLGRRGRGLLGRQGQGDLEHERSARKRQAHGQTSHDRSCRWRTA